MLPQDFVINYQIGGCDLSFFKQDPNIAISQIVIMDWPKLNVRQSLSNLKIVYEDSQLVRLEAPYIPGFLAFREVFHLQVLFKKVIENFPQYIPQVILVDGNGILHQNGCGLASHLGVLLNISTIGVGKTIFNIDGIQKVGINS